MIYCLGIAYVSYIKFQYMYTDAIFNVVLYSIAAVFGSYVKLLNSKTLFFNEKQIKRMMNEQVCIFDNLPDGALIHKQLSHHDFENDGMPFNMITSNPNMTRIKF